MTGHNGQAQCALLALPVEIRLEIWMILLQPPDLLVMKSLFIRRNYRNVFMSQQAKKLTLSLLRVCKQITAEALPVLYAQPTWLASCRMESLASQIGTSNFGLIKRLCVDADDMTTIIGSLILDIQEREPSASSLIASSAVELSLELDSRALMENMMLEDPSDQLLTQTDLVSQRRLKFSSLDILEVEGYQAMALTSRGNRKSRREGLRLCNFARQILRYHPTLDAIVEQAPSSTGGSDALDYTMARVKWRFLRVSGTCAPGKTAMEHWLDIDALEEMLRALIDIDEGDSNVKLSESKRVAGWLADGTFLQYPYLSSTPMMA